MAGGASKRERPAADPDWTPIADRLNPKRRGYDAGFAAEWANMGKKRRKKLLSQDRAAIERVKARSRGIEHSFPTVPDDHCETSPTAYRDIAPVLRLLADRMGKQPAEFQIYDPYFCAGSVKRHLGGLGYTSVYNENEDFYAAVEAGGVPEHDVLLTNPPYSGDHVEQLARFAVSNCKPFLLLLPEHFASRPSYRRAISASRPVLLVPRERYHYWTPAGLREGHTKANGHHNLQLGHRNSPYASHWHLSTGSPPLVSVEELTKALNVAESQLRLFERPEDIGDWGSAYRSNKPADSTVD